MEKSSQSSLDLVNNGVNFIRNPFIVGHNQNDLCAAMIKDPDKIKKIAKELSTEVSLRG